MLEITNWNDLDENKDCIHSTGLNMVEVEEEKRFINIFLEDEETLVKQKLIWKKESLGECVSYLNKMGFQIKYSEKFVLKEFLERSLKPKEFRFGEINLYFTFDENNYITLLNAEDVKTLNCKYFSKKIDDISCVEATLESEKVTIGQLKFALRELGWR